MFFQRAVNFIKESRGELKKVTWPTKETTINNTIAVIAISAAVAAFLGALDYVFRLLLNLFIL